MARWRVSKRDFEEQGVALAIWTLAEDAAGDLTQKQAIQRVTEVGEPGDVVEIVRGGAVVLEKRVRYLGLDFAPLVAAAQAARDISPDAMREAEG